MRHILPSAILCVLSLSAVAQEKPTPAVCEREGLAACKLPHGSLLLPDGKSAWDGEGKAILKFSGWLRVRPCTRHAFSDDLLDTLSAVLARPTHCFPGALIGPAHVTSTLSNNPPKIVSGPGGSSGEETAEVGYEIGSSSSNSPTVDVTAR